MPLTRSNAEQLQATVTPTPVSSNRNTGRTQRRSNRTKDSSTSTSAAPAPEPASPPSHLPSDPQPPHPEPPQIHEPQSLLARIGPLPNTQIFSATTETTTGRTTARVQSGTHVSSPERLAGSPRRPPRVRARLSVMIPPPILDADQPSSPETDDPESRNSDKNGEDILPPQYEHRKGLPGRPTENCAADSRHFSRSKSLVWSFIVILELRADADGKAQRAQLQCAHCYARGDRVAVWDYDFFKPSTGRFVAHFKSKHEEWWSQVQKLDGEALNGKAVTKVHEVKML